MPFRKPLAVSVVCIVFAVGLMPALSVAEESRLNLRDWRLQSSLKVEAPGRRFRPMVLSPPRLGTPSRSPPL